ncbi:MAG: hypothetical protein H6932_15680 [Burkholderiaceae bacterium]|nr:hypothetical protein [Burkholderiaceae bacterium]
MRQPCPQTYALRLVSAPANTLAGEIEHVLSGERRRFASGAELLTALQGVQQAVAGTLSTSVEPAASPHR